MNKLNRYGCKRRRMCLFMICILHGTKTTTSLTSYFQRKPTKRNVPNIFQAAKSSSARFFGNDNNNNNSNENNVKKSTKERTKYDNKNDITLFPPFDDNALESSITGRKRILGNNNNKYKSFLAVAAVIPTIVITVPNGILLSVMKITLISVLVPVILSAIQGAIAIRRFRKNYADAPAPRIPSHGIVLVRSKNNISQINNDISSSMIEQEEHNLSLLTDDDDTSSVLRLLVIGDSLAVGIGQSEECTPVMPQEIAKEISRETGKAVYWSCCGESGASTPWIIRMLQQSDVEVDSLQYNNDDDIDVGGRLIEYYTERNGERALWREKLDQYRALFDPDNLQTYDIVVLVTGTNDLKHMLLPFMLDAEDKELRKEMNFTGLIDDLRLFMGTLNKKMEERVQKFRDRMAVRVQNTLLEIRESAEILAEALDIDMDDYLDQIFGNSTTINNNNNNNNNTIMAAPGPTFDYYSNNYSIRNIIENGQKGSTTTNKDEKKSVITTSPLFVLPGMPARTVPTLRQIPIRWFALPAFDLMAREKKKLATSYPSNILYVDDPTLLDMINYEQHIGSIWEQSQENEEVMLSLKDVGKVECQNIEIAMKKYYETKANVTGSRANNDKPGTKSFSVDGIHPNEMGYKFFGRHIGKNIAKRLKELQQQS